jgi:4-diphosphocytidyl-2-C-methyl-D-erythritol kinase
MHVRSYAKINWALRVTGKRADGFHDLETLFQTVSLSDELTFAPAERLTLSCSEATIPVGESNLVIRAARALGGPPVAIHLIKRIPAGGGLGGGSSNAAATLLALDRMFFLRTSPERLRQIALALGSDVPFFLEGGTAYATGRGEKLVPLTPSPRIALLLLFPRERVSTPDAFRSLRRFSEPIGIDRYRAVVAGDFLANPDVLANDFEEPVFARLPQLRLLKERLSSEGAAWAGMSGSGSTIVGAFRSEAERDQAAARFRDLRAESATSGPFAIAVSEG